MPNALIETEKFKVSQLGSEIMQEKRIDVV